VIVGSGVVGLAIGAGLEEIGNRVVFYDREKSKVQELLNSGMNATMDLELAVPKSDFSFICVPTPNKNGSIDLSYVKEAVANVSINLRRSKKYHVIVIKSTIIPTSTERVIIPIIRKIIGTDFEKRIGLCVNPEFLTEFHSSWTRNPSFIKTWYNQDRIVIGELDKKSGDALESLYRPLRIPIFRTDLRTAEIIKYASNCMLACKISYWNEIYYICRRIGINSELVANVVGKDPRIGEYGTIHGKAFGGKCLPKDLKAFIDFCEKIGHEPKLLKAIYEINERIKLENGIRE
jgi:UDPglucose 6-dehydrogenase